jgi:DNA-binding MltR family transcriptional regulator
MAWSILGEPMMKAIEEFADSPSHRVVAIVGTSLLDEMLRRILEYRFIQDDRAVERAFKPSGFLGNISDKIALSYLLRIFGRDERQALVGISEIRNRFAHQLDIHQFEASDTILNEGFAKLILHEKYSCFPNPLAAGDSEILVERPTSRREIFIVNLQLLLAILMKDRQRHWPYSNAPQAEPRVTSA